jgi:hypothetical protein
MSATEPFLVDADWVISVEYEAIQNASPSSPIAAKP